MCSREDDPTQHDVGVRTASPAFYLNVGIRQAPFYPYPVHDTLLLGYLHMDGWKQDENMSMEDAEGLLKPWVDVALMGADAEGHAVQCDHHPRDGYALLKHLQDDHQYSPLLIVAWLTTRERPLPVPEVQA
jgi:hypothetical protein